MLKKNITEEELKKKITEYLVLHENDYTEEEIKQILSWYSSGMITDFSPELVRQLYAELDLMEPEHNLYLGFLNLIEQVHGINKRILEVGGGRIPSLGKYIAMRQQTGTITVYDPRLIIPSRIPYPNLILRKQRFDCSVSLENTDLIIGYMPEEATSDMIQRACETKTDFVIALSDMLSEKDEYELDEIWTDWQCNIIYDAAASVEKAGLGTLKTATLDKYDNPYPIIYNHRK